MSGDEEWRGFAPGDPDPVLSHGAGRRSPFLLVSDHAGNAVPNGLNALGLSAEHLAAHIGWDIDIWPIAIAVADALDAPLFGQAYSRLVIDSNRKTAAPDSIAAVSDGVAIPGNANLSEQERKLRYDLIMRPYQDRIATEIAARAKPLCIVSMHSFTPMLAGGNSRPWHIGVISGPDDRMRRRVYRALAADSGGLVIGDNEPYVVSMEKDYTLPVHAEGAGFPYVEFEMRNDSYPDAASRNTAAGLLARALKTAFAEVRGSLDR
jgi:predicted N-formylglutamate amidohydrolase